MKGWLLYKSTILLMTLTFFLVDANAQKPVKVVFSTPNSDMSQHVACGKKFKELAESYSKGKLKVQLHYMGGPKPNIGSDEDNARALHQGTGIPHVSILAVNNASAYAPILNFLSLPYMFRSEEQAVKLFRSDFMKTTVKDSMIKTGHFRPLGWLVGGFRHLTNSRREVKILADLKGLTIRTPQNPIMLATYHAFGADVMPIKWTDLYSALKDGTADGQENPYTLIADQQFWKANQVYITENGPILWIGPLLISEVFFQRLSPELKAILERAGEEACEYEWEWVKKQNDAARRLVIEKGMKVTRPKSMNEWIEAGKSVWSRFYEMIGDDDATLGEQIVSQAESVISN